ncbi:hypothetical protein [Rhodoplanes sp. SY1]|uniref:hypothetical protein n=1 Tax=Rhodoplanes sp. SY1 TaxID=3166646 RepID=UPI0038B65A76
MVMLPFWIALSGYGAGLKLATFLACLATPLVVMANLLASVLVWVFAFVLAGLAHRALKRSLFEQRVLSDLREARAAAAAARQDPGGQNQTR